VFWINNIDLVLSILNENGIATDDPEKTFFDNLLESKSLEFVEEELYPQLTLMLQLISKAEKIKIGQSDHEQIYLIANDFNQRWKAVIQILYDNISQTFPNFQNGARILHMCLARLLVYYKTFLGIWEKQFGSGKTKVVPVGLQSLLVEIKKYRYIICIKQDPRFSEP
jgi:hypothetical protein